MVNTTASLVTVGPWSLLSSIPLVSYIILVLLGIVGNAVVICVVGEDIIHHRKGGRWSDMILVNMAFSNLMVSVVRNLLLVLTDLGLEMLTSKNWCQLLMGIWVWLRCANVWSTFFVSAFHCLVLRRVGPPIAALSNQRRTPTSVLLGFGLIWSLNFIYSLPAFVYSNKGGKNATETIMLVTSTTRPLLGCLWDFPSAHSGLAYATTSMVIHEILPILLMSFTNLGSLLVLHMHGSKHNPKLKIQGEPVMQRIPAERRAAKVILALIVLFITSWGASILSVNYFNYNRGPSSAYLLVLARFTNSAFIALSPIILAVGHRRLRTVIASALKLPMALYIILVLLGILGNGMVIGVVGENIFREAGGGRSSDMILVNMAFSNLMVSVMRNLLLVISDFGLEVLPGKDWCQLLMGIWVWLRSVNVWSTFFLSAFHFFTLRRIAPASSGLNGPRGPPKNLIMGFVLIWTLNLLYSVPAFVYSTSGGKNGTETLMLVSSTTRPLLGCVWDFPSVYSGLAFATASMVIHEVIPIVFMAIANLGSLLTLYSHGRSHSKASKIQNAPIIRRVPAERRAAKVILALIMLFITSWGASVVSVNYFNYNRGPSSAYLLVIARFSNSAFIALSPIILAVGHRRLRAVIKSIISY